MPCPTCDGTMEKLWGADVWHCPRCGTVRQALPSPAGDETNIQVYVPKLVDRCREMWLLIRTSLVNRVDWKRLGIAESINVPEDRPT